MGDPIGDVPRGYVVHRVADTWLVLDAAHAPRLVQLRLADPAEREALFARAPLRGRGRVPSVPLGPDTALVLRRYRHGGLLGPLTRGLFLGPGRALAELRVTAAAEAVSAPVPHVLCVVVWPVIGPFWSALIGTREIPDAADLAVALGQAPAARDCIALARRAGHAVGRLHAAGIQHRDLQLRNIMVGRGATPGLVVIDLDRAVSHAAGLLPEQRAQNLGRLARSVVKCGLWGERVGPRALAAFVSAYLAGDRALRGQLRRRLGREQTKLPLYRMTYRFRRLATAERAASPLRSA